MAKRENRPQEFKRRIEAEYEQYQPQPGSPISLQPLVEQETTAIGAVEAEPAYRDVVLGVFREVQGKGIVSDNEQAAQAKIEKKQIPGGE